jgi:hypothetical protein
VNPPVAAGAPIAQDSFAGRRVSGGWGTASDGIAWSLEAGSSSPLSVWAGQGHLSGSSGSGVIDAVLGPPALDAEAAGRYASLDYANDTGQLLLDASGPSTYYAAGLDSPAGHRVVSIIRAGGGQPVQVASVALPAVDGTGYSERARVTRSGRGATVSVRVWPDGTQEPSGWTLSYTDADPLPTGSAGVRGWDDGRGWSFDTFSAGNLGAPTPGPTPVPVTASGAVFAQDSFAGRSGSVGWGAASDGVDAWTTTAGDPSLLSVSGGQGLVLGSDSMATINAILGNQVASDTEVVARYTSQDYSNDAGHLILRYSGASSYYLAGLDSPRGTPVLNIFKMSGGGATQVASVAFPATNGPSYWERARVETSGTSAVISVKAWADGTAEPAAWNLSYSDASPLPSGRVGVSAWDDGLGWAIDDLSAGNPASGASPVAFLRAAPATDLAALIAIVWLLAAGTGWQRRFRVARRARQLVLATDRNVAGRSDRSGFLRPGRRSWRAPERCDRPRL